jgi:hypothetical protein
MNKLLLIVMLLLIGYATWRLYPRTLSDAELRADRFTVTTTLTSVTKGDTIVVFVQSKP